VAAARSERWTKGQDRGGKKKENPSWSCPRGGGGPSVSVPLVFPYGTFFSIGGGNGLEQSSPSNSRRRKRRGKGREKGAQCAPMVISLFGVNQGGKGEANLTSCLGGVPCLVRRPTRKKKRGVVKGIPEVGEDQGEGGKSCLNCVLLRPGQERKRGAPEAGAC